MVVTSIDIGNTRTHIALVDKTTLQCIDRVDIITSDLKKSLLSVIDNFSRKRPEQSSAAVISSVQKTVLHDAVSLLQSRNILIREFHYTPNLPFGIVYQNPSALGTDRIANALFGYNVYPQKNLILISSGTALTIDLMVNRTFLGGAILPGLSMQFRSLHQHTDSLPIIDPIGGHQLPGRSTDECIRAGILYGTAGALRHIITQYTLKFGSLEILATGGAWPLLEDLIDFKVTHIPDMTLLGISFFTDIPDNK